MPTMTFIPSTVQENSIGGEVGKYKKSLIQGGEQKTYMLKLSDRSV